jgi:hypothetical protein
MVYYTSIRKVIRSRKALNVVLIFLKKIPWRICFFLAINEESQVRLLDNIRIHMLYKYTYRDVIADPDNLLVQVCIMLQKGFT